MSVKVRIKNNRLYLDIYSNGIRKWEALKISLSSDKKMNKEIQKTAEICRAKKELQILTGTWGLSDPFGGSMRLLSYMEKLDAEIYMGNKSRSQIYKSISYLRKFGSAGILLKQITPQWYQKVHDYLKNDCGLKPTSARSYEAAIRYAIRTAYKEKLISSDPTLLIKVIKKNEPDKIFLNSEELQQLADTGIKKKHKIIKKAFLFGCNTGLRISDLLRIKWGNIEYKPLQLIIRQQKTDRIVYIPLNDNAWNLINDYTEHKAEDKIFPSLESGKHYNILNKWGKDSGISKRIGWHTARHTFAVLSLENGVDIYTVSKLLGHSDIATTQVYAKATDKMKRQAVEALPLLKIS